MAITFGHRCNSGDVIAAMAGIKEVCIKMGEKAIIYQRLNWPGDYYKGAVHPVVHEGQQVCLNKEMFDLLRPLIISQDYIEDFVVFDNQKFTVDLDIIRDKCFVNIPHQMIQSWIMLAYPDMACDLSKPWIKVEDNPILSGVGVINYTERYRNNNIDYSFLKKYESRVVFAGTEKEYGLFYRKWDLNIPFLGTDNFLDLAKCLKGAKFFAGNQSFCWNLANAMGVPRILEICSWAANCQPFVGEKNFGYYHQGAAEYYFERLMA